MVTCHLVNVFVRKHVVFTSLLINILLLYYPYIISDVSSSPLLYSRQQYNLDLMIAIQLSRLQMLKDLKLLCAASDEDEQADEEQIVLVTD